MGFGNLLELKPWRKKSGISLWTFSKLQLQFRHHICKPNRASHGIWFAWRKHVLELMQVFSNDILTTNSEQHINHEGLDFEETLLYCCVWSHSCCFEVLITYGWTTWIYSGKLVDAYRHLHKEKDMDSGFSWSGHPIGK